MTLYDIRFSISEDHTQEFTEAHCKEITVPHYSEQRIKISFPSPIHDRERDQEMLEICRSEEGLSYTTKGRVGMKVWFKDLGVHSLGPWSYSYHCHRIERDDV